MMSILKLLLLCAAGAMGPPSAASPLTHIKNLKIIIIFEGVSKEYYVDSLWEFLASTLITRTKTSTRWNQKPGQRNDH